MITDLISVAIQGSICLARLSLSIRQTCPTQLRLHFLVVYSNTTVLMTL